MAIERIVPGTLEWEAHYANHIHRYAFAVEQLRATSPRHVLDVACGSGYGTRHLHDALGARVTGVDIDPVAIGVAREAFGGAGVEFLVGNAETLVLDAPLVDAIVSFETLEHVRSPEAFLARCRQLLVPEGRLLVSTPNSLTTVGEVNEFHVGEFTPTGLRARLTEAGFRDVRYYGQAYSDAGLRRNREREAVWRRDRGWMRRALRIAGRVAGRRPPPPSLVLPQRIEDFEMIPLPSLEACEAMGEHGPFVILAEAAR